MILYANGCSHTAAAEAVVPDAFAVDDGRAGIDRRPHPANLAASWCTHLAGDLGVTLHCDAESASSNDRIIRTTRDWIANNPDKLSNTFMVIQWTTWEREEWLHNGTWYQVNASGVDWVPRELHQRYKQFVIDVDWTAKTQECHEKIWTLHTELKSLNIPHLFYSGHSTFSDVQTQHIWGTSYMYPYNRQGSYNAILQQNGHVPSKWYHFDAKGHCFWANYVLQYIKQHHLVTHNALSTD
jgi:acyl-CoA thioesterase FadM